MTTRRRVLCVVTVIGAVLLWSNFWATHLPRLLEADRIQAVVTPASLNSSLGLSAASFGRNPSNNVSWSEEEALHRLQPLHPQSSNHSIVYVHVGKTGGTTLDQVLQANCRWYQAGFRRRKCLKELEKNYEMMIRANKG